MKPTAIVVAAAALLLSSMAHAADVRLLASGALKEAYLELLPDFEKVSGHKVTAVWSPTTHNQKRGMGGGGGGGGPFFRDPRPQHAVDSTSGGADATTPS